MQSSLFICLSILFFFLNGCTTLNVFFFFFQIQTFFLFFSLFKFFVCLSSFPISLFLYDFYLWSLISVPQGSFPFLFKKKIINLPWLLNWSNSCLHLISVRDPHHRDMHAHKTWNDAALIAKNNFLQPRCRGIDRSRWKCTGIRTKSDPTILTREKPEGWKNPRKSVNITLSKPLAAENSKTTTTTKKQKRKRRREKKVEI